MTTRVLLVVCLVLAGCAEPTAAERAAHIYDCIGWCHEYPRGMALEMGCACDEHGGYPTPTPLTTGPGSA